MPGTPKCTDGCGRVAVTAGQEAETSLSRQQLPRQQEKRARSSPGEDAPPANHRRLSEPGPKCLRERTRSLGGPNPRRAQRERLRALLLLCRGWGRGLAPERSGTIRNDPECKATAQVGRTGNHPLMSARHMPPLSKYQLPVPPDSFGGKGQRLTQTSWSPRERAQARQFIQMWPGEGSGRRGQPQLSLSL